MASIIATSIDLTKIPKDKIINGAKGKYLPITITLNDELDQFGNNGPVVVQQTKEEREAKEPKTYLGNVRVVWTNGTFPEPTPVQGAAKAAPQPVADTHDDIPF